MATATSPIFQEWSRYQWASIYPHPDDDEVARWNLVQWVGDQGDGTAGRRLDPVAMPADHSGLCGFGHNPSGTHWADGYSH